MREREEPLQLWHGPGVRVRRRHGAQMLAQVPLEEWHHPWSLDLEWTPTGAIKAAEPQNEWRATVTPGFLNGRDVFLSMPVKDPAGRENGYGVNPLTLAPLPPSAIVEGRRDVPLSQEPAPYLVLSGWRDPVVSTGVAVDFSGQPYLKPGEGYPLFFAALGVKPAAAGGSIGDPAALAGVADPARPRELRALDIVLTRPRLGTGLDVQTSDPLATAQGEIISTTYQQGYFQQVGGRTRLRATPKWSPPGLDDSLEAVYGGLVAGSDRQYDEILLSTVWMVSPPGALPADEPDGSWEPYAQYALGGQPGVFWNLNHATNVVLPDLLDTPLQLFLPLAGGVAQTLANVILTPLNDAFGEVVSFLNSASAKGKFWTP